MAMNRNAGVTKVKLGSSTKKAAVKKKALPKKAVAMKAASTKTAVPKKAAPKKASAVQKAKLAPKKAAVKKAVGPKLTASQHAPLKRVVANKDAKGYHTANKPEHRVLESLLKHKVIKKGPKHPENEVLPLSGFHNRQEVPRIGCRSQELIRDSIVRQTLGWSRRSRGRDTKAWSCKCCRQPGIVILTPIRTRRPFSIFLRKGVCRFLRWGGCL